jgi:REP-associated tyrosine transposase
MARGIERRSIFADDRDRESLIERIARLAESGALEVFAWVLMPNHFHLLVRTGAESLSSAMRRLLTGYAVDFNRRHGRAGHLFQNRYRSILCEEERYFLQLVRYIHLNPLRARLLSGLDELDHYPYTGHSALVGTCTRTWQSTRFVLAHFGESPLAARIAYRDFVQAGSDDDGQLEGGGLIRSAGGWDAVKELRRGREEFHSDERVLGGSEFVRALRSELCQRSEAPAAADLTFGDLVALACRAAGLPMSEWSPRSRRPRCRTVRDGVSFLWTDRLRRSGRSLALLLGVHPVTIHRGAERGRRDEERWERALVHAK